MLLSEIIIGLFVAAFLIFLRSAHSRSLKQKEIAVKLNAYLAYWQGLAIDNDMFSLYYVGVQWNEEVVNLIKSGKGAEDLVNLKKEKKKEIDSITKEIESDSSDVNFNQEDINKLLKKMPPNAIDYMLRYSENKMQNIVDGKTFITDSESSCLGVYTAKVCIELKMEIITIIELIVILFIEIANDPQNFCFKEKADNIAQIIWKCVVASKNVDTLIKRMEILTNESIFSLTISNMKNES